MNNPTPNDAGWHLDEYDADRFWSRVNRNGGTSYATDPLATATGPCWLWNATAPSIHYGRFEHLGKWQQAHRVSFKDFGNKLPDDLDVDHLCRIHNCVNPAHLEAVTTLVNVNRGQRPHGTHCKSGHEMTEENMVITVTGDKTTRRCRTCQKAYRRAAYLRTKAAKPS